MKMVRIDPPGTFCSNQALRDLIAGSDARTFLDVGCGAGHVSKVLCGAGLTGAGVDFSKPALAAAAKTMADEIDAGRYHLIEGDITEMAQPPTADLVISYMVMEHVEDDVGFVRRLCALAAPGGCVVVAVPGRMDCWSFEDDTVGHLRRYERPGLKQVLGVGGVAEVEVWSVAVPVANLLLRIGERLIKSSAEADKLGQSQRQQTETSGLQEIPWKTLFPPWVKVILNRYTLAPLFVLQRLFYRTDMGVILLGFGRVAGR